jgi:hypothetical protein
MVSVGFILNLLYVPRMLQAALLKHMGPVFLTSRRKRPQAYVDLHTQLVEDKLNSVSKPLLKSMIWDFSKRVELRLNVWLVVFACYLPSRCRSKRTNKLL